MASADVTVCRKTLPGTTTIIPIFCTHPRGHKKDVETRFGVAADAWDSAGHDGVLEAFTQSHPRVPEECETPVR